jgi:tetratricopeptide (TPR) repeat protein
MKKQSFLSFKSDHFPRLVALRCLLLLLLMHASFCCPLAAQHEALCNDYLENARDAFREKAFTDARDYAEAAIPLCPAYADTLRALMKTINKAIDDQTEAAEANAEALRLTALAIDAREHNPGLALRLLQLACDTVHNANELAVKTRRDLWNNPAAHPPTLDFIGHAGDVWSVAFSPDGKYVLTGSEDNTAKLWDLNGRQIQAFEGHAGSVRSVAFSPDGKYVLTGSYDHTAKLWDLNGRQIQAFEAGAWVLSVAFSPDGKYVLTGSLDNTAKLWDLNGRQIQAFEGHAGYVLSVAFSPDGKYVLTGSEDNTAKLWDGINREARYPLQSVKSSGYDVAFSREGDTLLVSRDNYFRLYYNEVVRTEKDKIAPLALADKVRFNISWTPEEYTGSKDPVRVQEYAFWLVQDAEKIMEIGSSAIGTGRIGSEEEYRTKLLQARALYERLEQGWNVARMDERLASSGKTWEEETEEEAAIEEPISDSLRYAAQISEQLALIQSLETSSPQDTAAVAQAYGNAAWYYLFTRQYQEAVDAASRALSLAPTQTWVLTNQAAGLLLGGRQQEALAIYTAWKDQPWAGSGSDTSHSTFGEVFLEDLEALEQAGVIPAEQEGAVEAVRRLLREGK